MSTVKTDQSLPARVNIASSNPLNFFRQLKEKFLQGYEVDITPYIVLSPTFLALEMTLATGEEK